MRLEAKLALFNALSKLLLVLLGAVVIPPIVSRVAVLHTDQRLREMQAEVVQLIHRSGISAFVQGEAYADYNILKQEYITLTPLPASAAPTAHRPRIFNERRRVDNETEDFRILSEQFTEAGRHYRLEIGSSLATVELLTDTLRRMALWMLVIGAALTIVTDAAFAHYLLRPLRQLIRRKLRGVHHPSAYSYAPLDTDTTDFRRLDDSLSAMMSKIQSAFEKEREFMSNVSHELLTPVSILQSRFENMLQDSTLGHAHSLKIVESQKTLYRLRNTVKTLLLIANIENEQYLREDAVSVAAVLAEIAAELEDRLAQRELQLQQDLRPDYVLPQANRTLVFTLLFNLSSNAIEYNCWGGSIRVQGRPGPQGGYVLRVTDTGPGIAPEHLPHLFDRFRRFQAGAAAPEGYGLGLPIAKTIAEFHKIGLTVAPEVGQGTTLQLQFP
ncbi:signal transduction histidine kinase [Hymenobacter luteus]|uniref:histidine kinase n=2 Tax=Hymenobacter TaxID=89966 RepID=A0A7W9WCI7_9BACT|nr:MULTISPECIES: HAMP domain-containing sensor histidine kinase [Hymenobacter]MBB4602150.1 signal transduction histidine kinase [Hymenobacter latericoloratus]MBB6059421.1 signal transduction histidine kinase [Hymenobacter luteus]